MRVTQIGRGASARVSTIIAGIMAVIPAATADFAVAAPVFNEELSSSTTIRFSRLVTGSSETYVSESGEPLLRPFTFGGSTSDAGVAVVDELRVDDNSVSASSVTRWFTDERSIAATWGVTGHIQKLGPTTGITVTGPRQFLESVLVTRLSGLVPDRAHSVRVRWNAQADAIDIPRGRYVETYAVLDVNVRRDNESLLREEVFFEELHGLSGYGLDELATTGDTLLTFRTGPGETWVDFETRFVSYLLMRFGTKADDRFSSLVSAAGSATITLVPSPASLVPLALGGAWCGRRRR